MVRYQAVYFVCDMCKSSVSQSEDTIEEAWKRAREAQWHVSDRSHVCHDCRVQIVSEFKPVKDLQEAVSDMVGWFRNWPKHLEKPTAELRECQALERCTSLLRAELDVIPF